MRGIATSWRRAVACVAIIARNRRTARGLSPRSSERRGGSMGMISAVPSPCLVLSPHLDDAVFSAWHVLARGADVLVATVFAGVPQPGFVTSLDRAHGAVESAAWVERRRVEDRDVVALTGCRVVH